MARRSPPRRRTALFVEGVNELTPRGRDDLRELWTWLCERSGVEPSLVQVHGFTKQQLALMAPGPKFKTTTTIPLDVLIKIEHERTPFDSLVVAFDALPPNQNAPYGDADKAPCLRLEKDFVLERFAESETLPKVFRDAARKLVAHQAAHRGVAREASRPPLGNVELVYMAPVFEALLMQDATALRAVFSYERTPKDWPKIPYDGTRPDMEVAKLIDRHKKDGPRHLRQAYKARKHAWAHEILRRARPKSAAWDHPIAERLKKVLVA